ncbi:hypothetical protein GCM10025856_23040 [Methylophaga marina]|nr:hypothetical protein GCM10025856_23040 [Methylophaga marina]
MRKILFASSEVHPLMKTGGLADVSASLPAALAEHGQDVRIFMPAYRQCLQRIESSHTVATIKLDGYHLPVEIIETTLPGTEVIVWLLNSPITLIAVVDPTATLADMTGKIMPQGLHCFVALLWL